MAQARSFREYVAHRFYNELFDAVQDFLSDGGAASLGIRSYSVRSIDDTRLEDIEIKHVIADDRPGSRIVFDVLVEAQFEISERDRHYDRYDDETTWIKVSCEGDLSLDLNDFSITNVCEYTSKSRSNNPMDDSLVPIIHHDQLENEALEFLRRFYPEALKEPTYIDPEVLAKRMGLSVRLRHITDDFSVFGQIHFAAGESQYYDKEAKCYVAVPVVSGEIFVDPDAYFLRNLGNVNNTIIHECVHWYKHRKAFELERLYNSDATKIKCRVEGGIKDNTMKSALDFMEWQANALTPRIQMPYTQTKVKVTQLIQHYRRVMQTDEIVDIMEAVIDEVAAFFVVSRAAAKIRLVDLGFEEAIGTFTYIDGRYVRPHGFKKGSLARNQTFSVSINDAVIESVFNPKLREKLQSGDYIYVDSHFCLNTPKYIKIGVDGIPYMTEYARHHIDECCLIFDLHIKKGSRYGKDYYTECVLCRDDKSDIVFEAKFSNGHNTETPDNIELLRARNKELAELVRKLPSSFTGTLKGLMEWQGVTVETLAERCGISPKTIQRLRNDEECKTTLETIVAICIGLKLPPPMSYDLIGKSRFSFIASEKHMAYRFLLDGYYTHTLLECNDLLYKLGIDPIGGEDA